MKRVVIISDLHAGHRGGLTPPDWQYSADCSDMARQKFGRLQRICWNFFTQEIDKLKPIDVLIVNGDLITGKEVKTGGTELLETDRIKQCAISSEAIMYAGAKEVHLIYGTPFHAGNDEDMENIVADLVSADSIKDHAWIDVNGLIFDVKHFIGSSVIPHGRATAILRDALWNVLWNREEGQPLADVFIRSHVHYHAFAGDNSKLCIVTPALQSYSKIGTRRYSGLVHYGFISFDVEDKRTYTWKSHILGWKNLIQPVVVK